MSQTHTIGRRSTTVHTQDGMTHVVYHSTEVVAFNENNIILRTGGWTTSTTKARMNQASNQFNLGYLVFQKNFEWFVLYRGDTRPFNDSGVHTLNRLQPFQRREPIDEIKVADCQ